MTRAAIRDTLIRAVVPLEAVLGQAKLRLSDVARLQVGDILALDSNVDEPIPIKVGEVPRFMAKPGRKKEQSSVQLVSLIQD